MTLYNEIWRVSAWLGSSATAHCQQRRLASLTQAELRFKVIRCFVIFCQTVHSSDRQFCFAVLYFRCSVSVRCEALWHLARCCATNDVLFNKLSPSSRRQLCRCLMLPIIAKFDDGRKDTYMQLVTLASAPCLKKRPAVFVCNLLLVKQFHNNVFETVKVVYKNSWSLFFQTRCSSSFVR